MRILLASLSMLALSACAQQTFVINDGPSALTTQNMDLFVVSGLGQSKTLNAAAVCGGAARVAKVEAQQDFVDGIIGVLTSGIVTPRKARVYCRR